MTHQEKLEELRKYASGLTSFVCLEREERKKHGFFGYVNVYKFDNTYFAYWTATNGIKIEVYQFNMSKDLLSISFEQFFKSLSAANKKHTLYYMHLFV